MIYFDNAATSLPKPPAVGRVVLGAINSFGGAGRSGHPAAMDAARCIYRAREAVAGLLGSAPERTVFTANATESLNIAIQGLLGAGGHAITTALEHNSVLRPLYRLRSTGMGLSVVDIDAGGRLDYGGFARSLRPDTKAVVCTHASNLTGTLVDIDFVSAFCKENGLLLIVDAAQTAGIFPIDADALGIDALCFTGHKGLLGPQGTGGICLREGLDIAPLKVGGSGSQSFSPNHPEELPDALEAGTLNAHGIAGLLAGIEYINETGMDNIRGKELALADEFLDGISAIDGLHVYIDRSLPHVPIVSLNIGDIDSAIAGDILAEEYGICVRCGAHCAPLAHMALGTRGQGAVRFSFSHFNTRDEIQAGIKAVADIAAGQGL